MFGCERHSCYGSVGVSELSDTTRAERRAHCTSSRSAQRRIESRRECAIEDCRAFEAISIDADYSAVRPPVALGECARRTDCELPDRLPVTRIKDNQS
jgi:hypothetical protein